MTTEQYEMAMTSVWYRLGTGITVDSSPNWNPEYRDFQSDSHSRNCFYFSASCWKNSVVRLAGQKKKHSTR